MLIEVNHFFDAAHKLEDTQSLITKGCRNLHGHTYHVRVIAMGTVERDGMVVDFSAIKNVINELDHTIMLGPSNFTDDIIDVVSKYIPTQKVIKFSGQPTAENIALYLKNKIQETYPDLYEIQVKIIEGFKGDYKSNSCTI